MLRFGRQVFFTCLKGLHDNGQHHYDFWKMKDQPTVVLQPRHLKRLIDSHDEIDFRVSFKSDVNVHVPVSFKAFPPLGGFGAASPDAKARSNPAKLRPPPERAHRDPPPPPPMTTPKFAATTPKYPQPEPKFAPPTSKHPPPEPAPRAPPPRGGDGAASPDAKAPSKPKLRSPQKSQKLPKLPLEPPRGGVGAASPDAKALSKLRSPQKSQKLQTPPLE